LTVHAAVLLLLLQIPGCGRDPAANYRAASEALLTTINNIDQGKYASALIIGRHALYAQRMIENDSLCAETSFLLGEIYRQLSDVDSSELSYRMGIEYAEEASDRRLRVRNAVGLSTLLSDQGRNDEAIFLAGEALPLARFSADTISMFRALNVLVRAQQGNGNFPEALRSLGQLIILDSVAFHFQGEPELRVKELGLLAGFKTIEEVRTRYLQLVKRFSLRNDQLALAELSGAWAGVLLSGDQIDSAYRIFTQVLSSSVLEEDPALRKTVLVELGSIQYRRGNFEDARRFYADALRGLTSGGEISARSLIGLQVVACEWKLRSARSLPVSDELLKRCESFRDSGSTAGFRPAEIMGYFLSGCLRLALNDTSAAWTAFLHARDRYGVNGMSFLPDDLDGMVEAFLEKEGGSWFQPSIDIASVTGRTDTAFVLEEAATQDEISRFFRNLPMRSTNADLESRIKTLQVSRQKYTRFERDLAECVSKFDVPPEEQKARRARIVARRQEELVTASTAVRAMNPSLEQLFSSAVPTVNKVQEALPTRGAVLKYVVAGGGVYALIVRKDTVVMKRLPGGKESIVSLIDDYTSMMAMTGSEETGILRPRGDTRKRIEDLSQLLHSLLIDPVEQYLRSVEIVYVRLPGSFRWLPLHTLVRGGVGGRAPLIQRFKISYLPVSSVLLFPQAPERAALQVVGFGHRGSSGWDVEYELADIRSFYEKAPMLFDSVATIDRLKQKRADILAIAAVFSINDLFPSRSGLLTSGGRTSGAYRVSPLGELAGIPVPQMVVLSEVSGTPGVLWNYVPMLFLAGGSREVVATMWRGDRKAKKYFGEVFYTASFNGVPGFEAYQRAVIASATSREFGSPDRWGLYYRFGK
jgi:tetratricopeptide (TPR) repeat protein/CHAT domain-containing protein